jgi:hypothetical protein
MTEMIGWLIDRYSDFREWLPVWLARRHEDALLRVRERIGEHSSKPQPPLSDRFIAETMASLGQEIKLVAATEPEPPPIVATPLLWRALDIVAVREKERDAKRRSSLLEMG